MAIRRPTLRQLRALMVSIGTETDATTRLLTRSWVSAWDELSTSWRQAMDDAIAYQARTGQWPSQWELSRIERLGSAMEASERSLVQLSNRAGVTVSGGAEQVVAMDADAEGRLVSSQLPAAEQAAALTRFTANVLPGALDVIVARAQGQIVSDLRPLSQQAADGMRRELIRGVAVGSNPNTAAAGMVTRVQGAFEGGLTRAINVARTEMLDAYRTASWYQHAANADVVTGWIWIADLGPRCCPSCWSMHGSTHPLEQPGPLDHQQGRCSRCPKTKTWRQLGFNIDEPDDDIPDARAAFARLPDADQRGIMGPGRLGLLRSGRIGWDDLPVERASTGWRTSYAPRTVGDLERVAKQRASAGIKPTPFGQPPSTPKWHRNLDGDLDGIARTIATRQTDSRQLGGGAFGDVRRVTYQDGKTLVRKEYGSRAEGARTGGLKAQTDAEQLAPLVIRAVGSRAPAVLRTGEREMYMTHVDGKLGDDLVQYGDIAPKTITDSDNGRLLGLADALMAHSDRNPGNWIITSGGLTGIDHGFAFMPNNMSLMGVNPFVTHFLGTANRWARTNDMSPADMAVIRGRLLALRPDFEHIGRGKWFEAMMGRMGKLESAASGTRSRLV
jgi:hypothetical protein